MSSRFCPLQGRFSMKTRHQVTAAHPAVSQKLLFKPAPALTQRVNRDCARATYSFIKRIMVKSNSTFETDKYLGTFLWLLLDHMFNDSSLEGLHHPVLLASTSCGNDGRGKILHPWRCDNQ